MNPSHAHHQQNGGVLFLMVKDLTRLFFQNLEKVFKHRDLKEKLLETKVTQANMILKEAEEKHRLEKDLVA